MRVTTEVKLELAILKELQKTDWSKPMKKSLQLLREEQTRNFDTQGFSYGINGYWQKLKESTKRQRARLGYSPSRPILVRSGKLKRGFKVTKVTKEEGEIKNTVSYAKYHQSGGKFLPQRKIIGSTSKSRKAIGLIFSNHIAGIIRGVSKTI